MLTRSYRAALMNLPADHLTPSNPFIDPGEAFKKHPSATTASTNWPVVPDVSAKQHGSNSWWNCVQEEEDRTWTRVQSKQEKRRSREAYAKAATGRSDRRVTKTNLPVRKIHKVHKDPNPYVKPDSHEEKVMQEAEKAVKVFLVASGTREVLVSAMTILPFHSTTAGIIKAMYANGDFVEKVIGKPKLVPPVPPVQSYKKQTTKVTSERINRTQSVKKTHYDSHKRPESQRTAVNLRPKTTPKVNNVRWAQNKPDIKKKEPEWCELEICEACKESSFARSPSVQYVRQPKAVPRWHYSNMVTVSQAITPTLTRSKVTTARSATLKKAPKSTGTSQIDDTDDESLGINISTNVASVPTLLETIVDNEGEENEDVSAYNKHPIDGRTSPRLKSDDEEDDVYQGPWYMEYVNENNQELRHPDATLQDLNDSTRSIVKAYISSSFGKRGERESQLFNDGTVLQIYKSLGKSTYKAVVKYMINTGEEHKRRKTEDKVGKGNKPPAPARKNLDVIALTPQNRRTVINPSGRVGAPIPTDTPFSPPIARRVTNMIPARGQHQDDDPSSSSSSSSSSDGSRRHSSDSDDDESELNYPNQEGNNSGQPPTGNGNDRDRRNDDYDQLNPDENEDNDDFRTLRRRYFNSIVPSTTRRQKKQHKKASKLFNRLFKQASYTKMANLSIRHDQLERGRAYLTWKTYLHSIFQGDSYASRILTANCAIDYAAQVPYYALKGVAMFIVSKVTQQMKSYFRDLNQDDAISLLHRLQQYCATTVPAIQTQVMTRLYQVRCDANENGTRFIQRFNVMLDEAFNQNLMLEEYQKVDILLEALRGNKEYTSYVNAWSRQRTTERNHPERTSSDPLTIWEIELDINAHDHQIHQQGPQASSRKFVKPRKPEHANQAHVASRPANKFKMECYICKGDHRVRDHPGATPEQISAAYEKHKKTKTTFKDKGKTKWHNSGKKQAPKPLVPTIKPDANTNTTPAYANLVSTVRWQDRKDKDEYANVVYRGPEYQSEQQQRLRNIKDGTSYRLALYIDCLMKYRHTKPYLKVADEFQYLSVDRDQDTHHLIDHLIDDMYFCATQPIDGPSPFSPHFHTIPNIGPLPMILQEGHVAIMFTMFKDSSEVFPAYGVITDFLEKFSIANETVLQCLYYVHYMEPFGEMEEDYDTNSVDDDDYQNMEISLEEIDDDLFGPSDDEDQPPVRVAHPTHGLHHLICQLNNDVEAESDHYNDDDDDDDDYSLPPPPILTDEELLEQHATSDAFRREITRNMQYSNNVSKSQKYANFLIGVPPVHSEGTGRDPHIYWLPDSGTSSHMTPFIEDLDQDTIRTYVCVVKVANENVSLTTHVGNVTLHIKDYHSGFINTWTLHNVLVVPEFARRLISIDCLTYEGHKVEFHEHFTSFHLNGPTTPTILECTTIVNIPKQYVFDEKNKSVLWSDTALLKASKDGNILVTPLEPDTTL
jgi:hypothetical protein